MKTGEVSPIKFTSKFGTCGRVVVAAEKKAFLYLLIVPVAPTKSVGFQLSWLGSLVVLPENGRGYRSSSTRVCCCLKSVFLFTFFNVRRSFSLFYIARTFIQPSARFGSGSGPGPRSRGPVTQPQECLSRVERAHRFISIQLFRV